MYCRPTCIVGPHVLRAHMHCGPTCVLENNLYNLYLSAHNTRGPTVHMGLLYMWANITLGTMAPAVAVFIDYD